MVRTPIGDTTPSAEEEAWWEKHEKEVNAMCEKLAGKDVEGEVKALEAEEEQLAEEYENEKKPEEDKDYDEWLSKTFDMVRGEISILKNKKNMYKKEDNHARLERRDKTKEWARGR